jgi:small subunit ribosomal protein S1
LKQLLGDPWDGAVRKYPVGATVEAANVISLQPFGAFVDLGDGIEGMIHIGDITREKRLEHPKEMLTVGTPVRAQVVEVDNQRRRIRLSMKQLEPTSADEYIAEHTVGEMVTGRIVDVGKGRAKVELAEGVTAVCKLPEVAESKPAEEKSSAAKADLGSLSAMLEAKWKKGGSGPSESPVSSIRVGQILQFKISALDAAARRVDVEL